MWTHIMWQGTPAKTGQTTPLICGENAGQHIYIDAGAYTTSSATFALTMTGSTARSWKIKVSWFASYANFDCIVLFGVQVSQIECSSLTKPPGGCMQFHTGSTGTVGCAHTPSLFFNCWSLQVRSLNYQDSTAYEHLQSTSYTVSL